VGDCGGGNGVEALEERGDAGFERAVFGHGGYVLVGHFLAYFLLLITFGIDGILFIGISLIGESVAVTLKSEVVVVTSASLGYFAWRSRTKAIADPITLTIANNCC
jgi:hypothetical protein